MLGKFLRIDKRIKVGTTAKMNREVGKFETERKSFQANVFIAVIEKDLLFNDVNSIKRSVKVDTGIAKPQQFVFEIRIRETRSMSGKPWGKREGVFKITIYKDSEREYFTILEGPYRGKAASVILGKDGSTQFIAGIKHKPMVSAVYSISQKTFVLNNKKYQATEHPKTPWKKEVYDIEIPDAPHEGGETYKKEARLAKIWFRISHSGKRYLHPGKMSLGCMTITEIKKWDGLCETLLKARKGDFMSVGVVEVID